MLRVVALLVLGSVAAFAASSVDDRMLVGTWQSWDVKWRVIYMRDHTFIVAQKQHGKYVRSSSGTWRIDRSHLEAHFTHDTSRTGAAADETLWKRIVELSAQRFTLEGEHPYVRAR
jgi:hypothetical protein